MLTSLHKKIILTFLMSLLLGVTYAGIQTSMWLAEAPLVGDVNHDSEVDITDVLCVVDYILGKPLAGFDVSAADINQDAAIDISDVLLIVDIILGIHESEEQNPNADILFPMVE